MFGCSDLYGDQAQYVRFPYANLGSRYESDSLSNEQVLFLTDIFPTGYTVVMWADLIGGETVAIFGAGPVGFKVAKSAYLHHAKRVIVICTQQYRLDRISKLTGCDIILWKVAQQTVEQIRDLTAERRLDVYIDAVRFDRIEIL